MAKKNTEKNKIRSVLSEAGLSNESLDAIEEAFTSAVNEKVSIHVEKALTEQDEEYSAKLEQLIEAIDNDHTKKLDKVMEAIDRDAAKKLKMVINKYEKTLHNEAGQFKNGLIDKISSYLDVYLEQTIPSKEIKAAVRNEKARRLVNTLRENLAIDSALEKKSIKSAVVDGKKQIDESRKLVKQLYKQNKVLSEKVQKLETNLILEQRTAELDEKEAKYLKKMFQNRDPKFINEQFDYARSLYGKTEEQRLESLKESAFDSRKVKDDTPKKVIEEKVEQPSRDPYMDSIMEELKRW